MPSITSLIKRLEADFPDWSFTPGDTFSWQPTNSTIVYDPDDPQAAANLLHELAHVLLGHKKYRRDVELLRLESEAWTHAKEALGPKYAVSISDDIIEDNLDSYRDWLHARSTCPQCAATGVQIDDNHYKCPVCSTVWRVNEAKTKHLRRYKTKHP